MSLIRNCMLNLTPMQSSIYYEQEIAGINANIGGHLHIPTSLDPVLFAEAFQRLVRGNDAFRLAFGVVDGSPQQWIEDESPVTLEYVDLSHEGAPETVAEDWMRSRFEKPFTSYTNGLVENALLKVSDSLYLYHAKANHLVVDGLSYALWVQRLLEHYKSLRDGDSCEVSHPSVIAFFEQQEAYLSSARYDGDRAYWLDQHDGSIEPLFQQPPLASTSTNRVSLVIDPATYARIEQLGRASESGTASVFLGVVYAYFSRFFDCESIVLGLPVHNRGSMAMRKVIGPLVNVNAARFSYDRKLPFIDLVRQVALDRRHNYRHQRYPINHLGRDLGIYSRGRRRPFEIGFSFEPSDFALELDGSRITAIQRSNGVQHVPMNFTLCEYDKAQDIWLHLDYQTSVVRETDARGHLERIESVLLEVLRDPNRPVERYSILARRDREMLREQQQRSAQSLEKPRCLHQLVAEQASIDPERLAVEEIGGASLSYRALNQSANRLARCLRESGLRAGAKVGMYLNRSAEMMVAALGILKAGAVYVPIDNQWPEDRCRFILDDAGVELVLTTSSLMESCPLAGIDFLLLDGAATDDLWLAEYLSEDTEADTSGVSPEDPAYVLYTSGSTGRPKGAMITHRGLVNYLHHAQRHYMRPGIEGSVVSSPLSFDATITTLFTPLLTGARVTLLPDTDNMAVLVLLNEYLFDPSASRLFKITPAHLDALAAQARGANAESRHVIVVGGEQLTAHTLAPWRARLLPSSAFINEYGPTETVVGCSVYEVEPGGNVETSHEGAIPIGRAIQNTQLHVVYPKAAGVSEAALQPSGATGELYIGGVGLAREYLNSEALTTERFVADPFSGTPGARLYRTGDLVRLRWDGELEYLGRADHQIKLRGYRIEPGELESRLRDVPQVRHAVVLDRRDATDQPYLAAYLVPEHTEPFDESGLVTNCRSHLERHVPDYMVPAAFVCLRELPLTTNGKLDRAALPEPDGKDFNHAAYVAPRNEKEAHLCRLWSDVLGVERVGPHDNFFHLGGHSLKATILVSRIREVLRVEVPLHAVFSHPTAARLAGELDGYRAAPLLDGILDGAPSAATVGTDYEEGEL